MTRQRKMVWPTVSPLAGALLLAILALSLADATPARAAGSDGAAGAASPFVTPRSSGLPPIYGIPPTAPPVPPSEPVAAAPATPAAPTGDVPPEEEDVGNLGIRVGGGSRYVEGVAEEPLAPVPDLYVVQTGDTLWDICDYFFGNPWFWPKIWSYNPMVTNPHWIYPGDVLRLRPEVSAAEPIKAASRPAHTPSIRLVSHIPPGTIYLRRNAFVTRKEYERHGTITAATDEKRLLSVYDEIYIRFPKEALPRIHDRVTIYDRYKGARPSKAKSFGYLVMIHGTAEVLAVDEKNGIATARIIEALEPIERTHRAGPIQRSFKVVGPRRNEVDLDGHVIEAIHDIRVLGSYHVVIIDKGSRDGVREGNRFQIVRRGDGLLSPDSVTGKGKAKGKGKGKALPLEEIAEALVVEAREETSTALVLRSMRDVAVSDRAVMRKGYGAGPIVP